VISHYPSWRRTYLLAYCTLICLSYCSSYTLVKGCLLCSNEAPVPSNTGRLHPWDATLFAHARFSSYIEMMGDKMPASNHVHLPSTIKWKDIYQQLIQDLQTQNLESICLASFRHMLAVHFSYVIKPRSCDTCTKLAGQLDPKLWLIWLLWAKPICNWYLSKGGHITNVELPALPCLPKSWSMKKRIPFAICGIINHYLGYFEEIHVSFLPAGHTHEDIDQMFSIFRKYLNHALVLSLEYVNTFLTGC
jgi:hypothetical protein